MDHGGAIPTTESDRNTSSNCLALEATVVFDAVEHPLELEPESELNVGEDEEHEENGETSEVSDEGETDGEDEYNFQFQGEMDPLSFAEEEDASGLQPYERFERIQHHYEVLAAKKRPALQNNQRYAFIYLFIFFHLVCILDIGRLVESTYLWLFLFNIHTQSCFFS